MGTILANYGHEGYFRERIGSVPICCQMNESVAYFPFCLLAYRARGRLRRAFALEPLPDGLNLRWSQRHDGT